MRWVTWIALVPLFLTVAYSTLWGSLAIWFKLPGPEPTKIAVAASFASFGVLTLAALFRSVRWRWLVMFGALFAVLLVWWNTLEPTVRDNWSPEVARQVTGEIEGDTLTLYNVRAFEWRSEDDFTAKWVTRTYDLAQIQSLDLYMSYWGGPAMAHLMLSFGFADGEYLTWSVEVRRSVGESFSPLSDFFKANSVSLIASEEKDVVGVRSNIRKEEVFLFRLKSDPMRRRKLLEGYVNGANRLSQNPEFFHSVFTNCSKTVIDLARTVGAALPTDWRIIVNGYFPEYLYELGVVSNELGYDEVRQLGNISQRARPFGLRDGFSEAIREGVPEPQP